MIFASTLEVVIVHGGVTGAAAACLMKRARYRLIHVTPFVLSLFSLCVLLSLSPQLLLIENELDSENKKQKTE